MNSITWEEISRNKSRQAEIGPAEQPQNQETEPAIFLLLFCWVNCLALLSLLIHRFPAAARGHDVGKAFVRSSQLLWFWEPQLASVYCESATAPSRTSTRTARVGTRSGRTSRNPASLLQQYRLSVCPEVQRFRTEKSTNYFRTRDDKRIQQESLLASCTQLRVSDRGPDTRPKLMKFLQIEIPLLCKLMYGTQVNFYIYFSFQPVLYKISEHITWSQNLHVCSKQDSLMIPDSSYRTMVAVKLGKDIQNWWGWSMLAMLGMCR